jgi:hypothetical protein
MKKIFALAALFASLATSTALAEPIASGQVGVKQVMCSLTSGQCTAVFDGEIASDNKECSKVTARWDARTAEGQNMLSLVQVAHLSGKKVIVWHEGCMGNDRKLAWLRVN